VFETKEVLISCWLIALGFQRSGVEGGSASNINGLRSFRGEDDGMRVVLRLLLKLVNTDSIFYLQLSLQRLTLCLNR
jgi:hypothetical protein